MAPKRLPRIRLTFRQALLWGLSLWAVITFLSWLFKDLFGLLESSRSVSRGSTPPSLPPLTITDLLLGSGALVFSLWSYWAWRPRRKHGRWHRWLVREVGGMYISFVILLAGMKPWNILLKPPWNWVVNGLLLALFVTAWILPALSYPLARKIRALQDAIGIKMLKFGGPAGLMVLVGILGARYGRDLHRQGKNVEALLLFGFGFPLVSIFLAQYNATDFWPYRPWAKEEK